MHLFVHPQTTNLRHAIADGADTGQQHPVGAAHLLRVGGHPHLNAGLNMFQRLGHRVQVAHAVIDYCDAAHDLQTPLG